MTEPSRDTRHPNLAIPVLVGLALAAASPAFAQNAPDPADRQVRIRESELCFK